MIHEAVWADVREVARNMRERDAKEVCALAYTDDPVTAVSCLQTVPFVGATVWRDVPIAAVGALFMWPGVVSAFMFATDRWPEVALETTRYVRKVLIPSLYAQGVHRMQCHSLVDHEKAHRWLESFGATATPAPQYGKGKEDFVLYVLDEAGMARVTSVGN